MCPLWARPAGSTKLTRMNTHDFAEPVAADQPREKDWLVIIGRGAILLTVAAALGWLSVGLLFIASIALTGCFMSCTDPNYVAGFFAAAGLAVSLAAMVTAAAAAFVPIRVVRFAKRALLFMGGLVAIGALLMVANP